MLDIKKWDEVIARNHKLIRISTHAFYRLYLLNLTPNLMLRAAIMNNTLCRALPSAEEDFKHGVEIGIEDYQVAEHYQNKHVSLTYTLSYIFGNIIAQALFSMCAFTCTQSGGLSSRAASLIVTQLLNVLMSYIDRAYCHETSIAEGYDSGFIISCFGNKTKPGCQDPYLKNKLGQGLVNAQIYAVNYQYHEAPESMQYYQMSCSLFYFIYAVTAVLICLDSRAEKLKNANLSAFYNYLYSNSQRLSKSEIALYKKHAEKLDQASNPEWFCPITHELFRKPVLVTYTHAGRHYRHHFEHRALLEWWQSRSGDSDNEMYNTQIIPFNNIPLAEVTNLSISHDLALKNTILNCLREKASPARAITTFHESKTGPFSAQAEKNPS